MTLRLNLAALTSLELERLLGVDAARQMQPDLSAARLARRPLLGHRFQTELNLVAVPERTWGATPEDAYQLRQQRAQLEGAGLSFLGTFALDALTGQRFLSAYLSTGKNVLVALRWSEARKQDTPAVQLISWLRDELAGTQALVSWNTRLTPTLEGSPAVVVKEYPDLDPPQLLGVHLTRVKNHGKAESVSSLLEFESIFQRLWEANIVAWKARGVLMENRK
ncbi:MAG: hypothetical protein H7095_05355 [Pseudopedobacter sp.]|nr:hypothetical protein [Deinococcales bacterium]